MDEHHDSASNGHASGSVVLAGSEARVVEQVQQSPVPAPVVAAAGGALAGALAFVLLRALKRAPRAAAVRIRRRKHGGFEITSSRSFLVDVHMLKR